VIALLVDGPLTIRPNELVRWLNALDKDHVWTHAESGLGDDLEATITDTLALFCTGPHGVLMTVMNLGGPLDATLVDEARARSWWYEEGERAAAHQGHWVIASGNDKSWEGAVLRAKASTLIAGLLIQDNPSIVAVWNGVNGTLFTPDSVRHDMGLVGRDQVPLAFWTYSALHSLTDGDVSITTGGMAPFIGYELEVWRAPRTAEVVNAQMNAVSNYLLARGPILRAGETIGLEGDAETLHCEFGPSRAERNKPTQALFLTFVDAPLVGRPLEPKVKPSFLGKLFGRS
jgi:hypothetical protein